MPPEPEPPEASDRIRTTGPRLPGSIDRSVVPGIVDRCCRAMPSDPGVTVVCDAGSPFAPRLPTVEVLARLALIAHRNRQAFRVDRCGPPLLDLLDLCGLVEAVGALDDPDARARIRRRGAPAARRAGRTAAYRGRT
jgi:hypothetical protein